MKKFFAIFFCLMLFLNCLTSCANQNQKQDELSVLDENFDVESVEYFKGEYCPINYPTGEPMYSSINVMEKHVLSGGLRDYLRAPRNYDTYFLVGVSAIKDNESSYDDNVKFTKSHLEKCGFIEIEDHPMSNHKKALKALEKCKTEEEKNAVKVKYYIEERFSDTLANKLKLHPDDFFELRFTSVGYINVQGIRELAQITKGEEKVWITWFPAPDNQNRWLTISSDFCYVE